MKLTLEPIIYIIIILIIVYIFYRLYLKPRIRKQTTESLINKSNGTFDDFAQSAFNQLDELETRTPIDSVQLAYIMDMNMMEAPIYGIDDLSTARRIATSYQDAINNFDNLPNGLFVLRRMQDFDSRLGDDITNDTIIRGFRDTLELTGEHIFQNKVADRVEQARNVTSNNSDATDIYFDTSTTFTNDPQNVHDTSVNTGLKSTYEKISNKRVVDIGASFDEAKGFIEKTASEDKRQKALATLQRIEGSPEYLYVLGASEDIIFANVWERSKHRLNEENRHKIQEAIVESLADCWENGSIVCVNGRCGRIITSLVLLDFDDSVGDVKTLEAFKAEIFQLMKEMIDDEVQIACGSDDAELRKVGESYNDPKIEVSNDAEERFKALLRKRTDEILSDYIDRLSPDNLRIIREECLAGIF